MMDYKSFREQVVECKESGDLVEEKCIHCGKVLLICKRYGGQCISYKCGKERGVKWYGYFSRN